MREVLRTMERTRKYNGLLVLRPHSNIELPPSLHPLLLLHPTNLSNRIRDLTMTSKARTTTLMRTRPQKMAQTIQAEFQTQPHRDPRILHPPTKRLATGNRRRFVESKLSECIRIHFTQTATRYRDVCYSDWKKAKKGTKKAFEAYWNTLSDNEKEVCCTAFDLNLFDSYFVVTSRTPNGWENL